MCAVNGFSLHKCELSRAGGGHYLKKKYQMEVMWGGVVLPQSCKKEIIKYKVQIKLILICCSTGGREGAPY